MYCKNCGSELNNKALICPKCGCGQPNNKKKNGCLIGCFVAFLITIVVPITIWLLGMLIIGVESIK